MNSMLYQFLCLVHLAHSEFEIEPEMNPEEGRGLNPPHTYRFTNYDVSGSNGAQLRRKLSYNLTT